MAESNLASDAPWKEIQKNTFTRWCNEHLHSVDRVIHNLQSDLGDGLTLIALLEALSHKKMSRRYHKQPRNMPMRLDNVSVALEFLQQQNIKLVCTDSKAIVDGNMKLILGLMWTLIQHYSISKTLMTDVGAKKLTPQQLLLGWIQQKIPELPIPNFKHSWMDGKALGALVDGLAPGLCPEWKSWHEVQRVDNAREAMQKAEEWLGVPQIITPEEIVNPAVDEQSIMTYLSMFPKAQLKPGAPLKPRSGSIHEGSGKDENMWPPPPPPPHTEDSEDGWPPPPPPPRPPPPSPSSQIEIPDVPHSSNISDLPDDSEDGDIDGLLRWLKTMLDSNNTPSLCGLNIEDETREFNQRAMNVKKALRLYNLLLIQRYRALQGHITGLNGIADILDKVHHGRFKNAVLAPVNFGLSLVAKVMVAKVTAPVEGKGTQIADKECVDRKMVEKIVQDYRACAAEVESCVVLIHSGMDELRRYDLSKLERAGAHPKALRMAKLSQTMYSKTPIEGMLSERLLQSFERELDAYFKGEDGQTLRKSAENTFMNRVCLLAKDLQGVLDEQNKMWEIFSKV